GDTDVPVLARRLSRASMEVSASQPKPAPAWRRNARREAVRVSGPFGPAQTVVDSAAGRGFNPSGGACMKSEEKGPIDLCPIQKLIQVEEGAIELRLRGRFQEALCTFELAGVRPAPQDQEICLPQAFDGLARRKAQPLGQRLRGFGSDISVQERQCLRS